MPRLLVTGLVRLGFIHLVLVRVVLVGAHQIGPRSVSHPLAADVVDGEDGGQADSHQIRQNARVRAGTSLTMAAKFRANMKSSDN